MSLSTSGTELIPEGRSEGLQASEIVPLLSEPEGAKLEAGLGRVNQEASYT